MTRGETASWLLEHSAEILLALDAEHRVIAAAGGAREHFGESLEGKRLTELGDGLAELSSLCVRVRSKGGVGRAMNLLIKRDGRTWSGRARVRAPHSTERGAVLVVSMHLEAYRPEREGMLRSRRRSEMLHHLAAGLAHEIRNPLSAMRGAAQLLQRRARSEQDEERVELSTLIVDEADRVEGLVAELMDTAKQRPLRVQAVDLSALAFERGNAMRAWPEAAGRELDLRLDPSLPPVEGDPELLGRALDNLLRNALTWAGEGGRVELATGLTWGERLRESGADRGRALWFRVSDSGPGVRPELADRIFDPLVSGREDGTGLGLFTVRRVADEHGGVVEVGESPLGGAAFTLRLWERRAPGAEVDS